MNDDILYLIYMRVVFPHKRKSEEKLENKTTHFSIKRAPFLVSLSLSLRSARCFSLFSLYSFF
jgi:hypothetical protein